MNFLCKWQCLYDIKVARLVIVAIELILPFWFNSEQILFVYFQWPHLASLYASTHNLDEEGKNPDPMMGQDNVFDPSEPYGAYRYYMQPSVRSEFSIEEPAYLHRPMYKDEESRSSDYTSGDSFRKGSTCRVLLCVFLIFSFIAVVVAAITLAVLRKLLSRKTRYLYKIGTIFL